MTNPTTATDDSAPQPARAATYKIPDGWPHGPVVVSTVQVRNAAPSLGMNGEDGSLWQFLFDGRPAGAPRYRIETRKLNFLSTAAMSRALGPDAERVFSEAACARAAARVDQPGHGPTFEESELLRQIDAAARDVTVKVDRSSFGHKPVSLHLTRVRDLDPSYHPIETGFGHFTDAAPYHAGLLPGDVVRPTAQQIAATRGFDPVDKTDQDEAAPPARWHGRVIVAVLVLLWLLLIAGIWAMRHN